MTNDANPAHSPPWPSLEPMLSRAENLAARHAPAEPVDMTTVEMDLALTLAEVCRELRRLSELSTEMEELLREIVDQSEERAPFHRIDSLLARIDADGKDW